MVVVVVEGEGRRDGGVVSRSREIRAVGRGGGSCRVAAEALNKQPAAECIRSGRATTGTPGTTQDPPHMTL